MSILWRLFRMALAKRVVALAEATLYFVPRSCTRGLAALARALVPEVYRDLNRGERVHRF
jgi:hypothetical protein